MSQIYDVVLIVQGSGIGPTLYVVMKSDLHALSQLNDLYKYADDTTLLVPQLSIQIPVYLQSLIMSGVGLLATV